MSEWNSNMEEAPKDGTEILACFPTNIHGKCAADFSIVKWENGSWVAQAEGMCAIESQSDYWGTDYVKPFVTHWMPLPPPPDQQ